ILQACGDGSSDPLSAKAFAAPPPASAAPARAAAHWTPSASDTWQWQLRGKLNTSYNVAIYDIDLFDTDPA
ncbi:hypothetical protein, partial [Escherichia coli]